jgi:acetoin:2,6-dichlorophenolindophenol oxidoreductase subunit beta
MTELRAPLEEIGAAAERIITQKEAIREALDIALGLDESVIELGEDINDPTGGGFGIHKGLSTKYGLHRVRPTPISEQAIIGASIGAAITGLRPVPEIMLMNFIHVCMDQLINHAAKLRYMSGGQLAVPITVRTVTGAGGGFGAQHSDMLESALTHSPGLKVVVPATPADAKGLLLSSIFDDDPVVFIEMHFLYGLSAAVPEGDYRVPLGSARIARDGSDVSVISWGRQVNDALAVAEKLQSDGVSVEVVDVRSLVPLDIETIMNSVAKTKRAVVLHEAVRRTGYGAEIAATISEELFGTLQAPVRRLAAANTPVPFAKTLEMAYLPSQADLEALIRGLLD